MKVKDILIEKYNLKTVKKTRVYAGQISGYYTVIFYNKTSKYEQNWIINIAANKKLLMENSQNLIYNISKINKVQEVKVIDSYLSVKLKLGITINSNAELMDDIINIIINYFKANTFIPGDFRTGDIDQTIQLYNVNGVYLFLSEKNLKEVQNLIDEEMMKKSSIRQNYFLGILGAILGAFIGAVIWTAISLIGYYVFYIGLLTIVLATLGYRILGKKIGVFGSIFSLIVSIFFIYLSIYANYLYNIYMNLKDITTFIKIHENFRSILDAYPLIKDSYNKDLSMVIIPVTILGIIYIIYMLKKEKKDPSILKIDL